MSLLKPKTQTSTLTFKEYLNIIEKSCKQVSRGVFFSTVIIITSFLPVFLLTGQEGKLFHPLAYTKTFIMLVDSILVLVLAPGLISIFMWKKRAKRGQNHFKKPTILERGYERIIRLSIRSKRIVLAINLLVLLISSVLITRLGREFMPPLDEGSILFMPVTLPDVSNSEIKRILQLQDKIIIGVPEVANVLGKAGRAKTATDNSPISMIETIILLKPKSQWRTGMTKDKIIAELNEKLQIPGVTNAWTMPIINRINMLATGIRTDVGIKVYGQNLDTIYSLSERIQEKLKKVPGVEDMYVEPITGGKYLDMQIKREEIARYNLTVDEVNAVIEGALGGVKLSTVIKGREKLSLNARYYQDFRNTISKIQQIPVRTSVAGFVPLGTLVDIHFTEGAPMINSENTMLRGAVLFNVRNRDLATTIQDAQEIIKNTIDKMPKGYFVEWSGQYEQLLRSERTLKIVIPIVLVIIFLSMYFAFNSFKEAFFSMISLPFALIGGVFMLIIWKVHLSIAVGVGFIALFGLAVETGIVMVIYLNDAMENLIKQKQLTNTPITITELTEAVISGAAQRLRPKLMTVCVTLLGLIPILWSSETGSDMMKPIVLPMIGGVFSSAVHILLVTPIIFLMVKEYELKKHSTIIIFPTKH